MQRWKLVLLLLPIMTLVGTAGWWLGRSQSTPVSESAQSDHPGLTAESSRHIAAIAIPATSKAGMSRSKDGVPNPAPLPALDVPLRLTVADLQRRADAGEAKAACRLAAEWSYCRRLRSQLDETDRMLLQRSAMRANMASRVADEKQLSQIQAGMKARLASIEARAEELITESAHCEGVPEAGPQAIARQWRVAAIGGHVPSMTHYAVGNAFRINETLQNLEALALYRREAEALASRAADMGDYNAAIALAAAYSPLNQGANRTYLAQVVKPDGVRSLSLYLRVQQALNQAGSVTGSAARDAVQDHITQLASMLSPGQRAQAQRSARQAVSVVIPEVERETRSVANGTLSDITREDCGDSPVLPD